MTTKTIPLAFALAALGLTPSLVRAQTAAAGGAAKSPAPAATGSAFDQFIQEMKKPADDVTLGGDVRVRNEYFNNIITLAPTALHEQDVIRYRARLWAAASVAKDFVVNARLSMEPRQWLRPAFAGAVRGMKGWEWRYGILDNLNVKWSQVAGLPLTLTVGRQDFNFGDFYDWWLTTDGTPNDGSWAFYLDAARLTYEAKEIKTKFDAILIAHSSQTDAWLPTIGRSDNYPIADQDEQGVILYASNKSIKDTQIDGYFFYKKDEVRTYTIAGAKRTPGDNADIGTLGSKITGALAPGWKYSVEGAYQFGSKADRISGVFTRRNLSAYGGKGKIVYSLDDSLKNQFSFGGELLSGDKPGSVDRDEMFDLQWGRWPRWSELYIYSYINETGGHVAFMNNLSRYGFTWNCVPTKGMTFSLTQNFLQALQTTPTRTVAPALFSNRSRNRGHYVQAILKYQFNKYLSGHLWAEWVWRGGYYTNREVLTFLRPEVMFSF